MFCNYATRKPLGKTISTAAMVALFAMPALLQANAGSMVYDSCVYDDPTLVSPTSNIATSITFVFDHSLGTYEDFVDIYWVEFDGNWKFYKKLYPGQSYTQQTYVGHNWVAKLPSNSCAYLIAGHGNTQTILDAD